MTEQEDLYFKSLYPTTSQAGPPCNAHILRVGSLTLLLDCGIDETYSQRYLDILSDAVAQH